ncbi:permease [Synergistales bacterium]|nr:permease [Synergistales bacterium]
MSFLEKQFKLTEKRTTVKTEIWAGITTFMTMAYIIFVNPDIISKTGMPFDAVMAATCLSAAVSCFMMAFMANYPIALASGMGLNAFFTFSVVLNPAMGTTWQMALAAVFIEGFLFVALTLTRLRETVANSIPRSLKLGIASGIGLFIAFVGFQNAGIIVNDPVTLVKMGSFRETTTILALTGLVLMGALQSLRITGGILLGIFAVTGAGFALGMVQMPDFLVSSPPSLAPIFLQFDFSKIGDLSFWVIVFTFFFVDFFDTIGTLVGLCARSGLLDEKGRIAQAKGALMADAVGTVVGATLGTTTVTSYIESASGIAQGGRTGLTAVVTGILFFAALFFSPLVKMIPSYATAPALVIVGIYMMAGLRDIDYDDWTELIPAILALFVMPLAYSISKGIEFGIVSYVLLKVFTGRYKDVSFVMAGLSVLFIVKEYFI